MISTWVPMILVGMTALSACSDPGDLQDVEDPASADQAALLSDVDEASCDGLFREEELVLADRHVRRRVCYQATPGSPGIPLESYTFVDEDGREGAPFSFQDALRFGAEMATSPDRRIAPAVRSRLNDSSPELVEVDLWYHFEEPPTPPKDELLASDSLLAEHLKAYQAAMNRGRIAVEEAISRGGLRAESLDTRYTAAPRLRIRASAATIRRIAAMAHVTAVTDSLESELESEIAHSEAFYDIDQIAHLESNGWDGTGITVANAEGALPDSTVNLSLPTGACQPGSYVCADAGGAANWHPRAVMGVVRNSINTLRGGAASDARNVFANGGGAAFISDQRATVINRSAGPYSGGSPQTSVDMYFDALAVQYPFPFVSISAGNNGPGVRVANNLRNGIVVGGADDHGNPDRSALGMYSGSQGVNYGGASGWELPHLVAPAVNIATAGASLGQVANATGTSFAAPQVAGIAAALQEQTGLTAFPEALIPAFLVGPEQDVAGIWPLNLHDGIDDVDGVGAVNARLTSNVLANRVTGGLPPAELGYDHGTINPSVVPANDYFPSSYKVYVPAGRTLRAAAVVLSRPTCGSVDSQNCTANPYPRFLLQARLDDDVSPGIVSVSDNLSQNYQYISVPPQSKAKTYELELYMRDWSGITSTFYGIAFTSEQ
jgi:hypothetical protein